jgi:putative intracellular protease/amidase
MIDQKTILMIVTSHNQIDAEHPTGLWFEEFAVPYQLFREQGYLVTVASLKGGQAPIDPRSAPNADHSEADAEALQELKETQPLSSVNVANYDAVFFPGGHGTMYDLPSPEVAQIVNQFADAQKVVAAVCHGPAALVEAKRSDGTPLVQGRKVTGFTNAEEQAVQLDQLMPFLLESRLRELGGEFVVASNWSDNVVVDGNLITGQNPQSSGSAAKAVIDALVSANPVKEQV